MNTIHRFKPGTGHSQISKVFRRKILSMAPATSGEEGDLVVKHRHVPGTDVAAREAANLSLARSDRRPPARRSVLSPMLPRIVAGLPQLLKAIAELDLGLRLSLPETQGN